jgi:hypothetical protein
MKPTKEISLFNVGSRLILLIVVGAVICKSIVI